MYLLTFIDHFTRYAEAFPIPDQTAETCARIYATQIVTRHDTDSKLITDQGRAFMSTFCSETCKILGVRKIHTTSYHPMSNGILERWHRSLHTGFSHHINASHKTGMWQCHFISWLTALSQIQLRNSAHFICHTEERRHSQTVTT